MDLLFLLQIRVQFIELVMTNIWHTLTISIDGLINIKPIGNDDLYLADIKIGNPPQIVKMALDTGSSDVYVSYSMSPYFLVANTTSKLGSIIGYQLSRQQKRSMGSSVPPREFPYFEPPQRVSLGCSILYA